MLFIYITRLASNEIFSPSNKIHREVGRAKNLSAPPYIQTTKLIHDVQPFVTVPLLYQQPHSKTNIRWYSRIHQTRLDGRRKTMKLF